jgi:hypothetical protein
MKAYGGVEVQSHIFLISALNGGEFSASHLSHFTSDERLQYPLDRRLGGPQNWY